MKKKGQAPGACPSLVLLMRLVLLRVVALTAARLALGLHGLELSALLRREDVQHLLMLCVAELRHLRTLRFHGRLERFERRRVVRFLRGMGLLPGVAGLVEERMF